MNIKIKKKIIDVLLSFNVTILYIIAQDIEKRLLSLSAKEIRI